MMSCLSASRGYRLDHEKARIGSSCNNSNHRASSPTSTSSVISDSKSSISSTGSEISSTLLVSSKKPRTRRKRPQEIYNEAAAALSAIYPKIFSEKTCGPHRKKFDKFCSSTRKKIERLRSGEEAELLFEVPILIRRVREVEETELLCNEATRSLVNSELECGLAYRRVPNLLSNDPNESPLSSESKSQLEVSMPSLPPSWEAPGIEYECLLDSSNSDIDEGIMSSIMGNSANPDSTQMDSSGLFGQGMNECLEEGSEYSLHCSAIRALRRASDSMICPRIDYSFPRLKLSEKIMAEKEMNAMSFCSLDWLKRDDTQQKLKLKLNYEDVLNTWSDRGSLYTDELQHLQTVPDDDSSSDALATSMNFDVVPDLGFWRFADDNGIYGAMEDRSSAIEDGMGNGSGLREASVLRYKEKRRTRLFSKKIRYEVRKLNAERRPRMKGRFVRRPAAC
eukprot:Gb_20872 [translate_table: standard]